MENELSNTITMILRNLYEDTQDRIRELSNEEMELDRQLQRLSEQIVDHEHFSVLDKLLLKRKQYQAHLESIKKRDYNDMHKPIGALKRTDDQIYIDSTDMTIDEVKDRILELYHIAVG